MKDQVYQYLKKAIINGELKTGEIYSEQMFATQLNISRTPVREAVLQLRHENMLEIYNNRGFMIKPLLFEDVKKLIEARVAIEGYSVRCLTRNIDTPAAKEVVLLLNTCLKLEAEAVDNEHRYYDFMQADVDFHGLIVDFTKNEYFINMIHMLRSRIEKAIVNSLKQGERMRIAIKEHEALFETIKSGDEDRAYASFERHMQNTIEVMKHCNLD
ncbi:GntR family transcriptional regulator [Anaerosinus massiliensis]|uniref:GntR family transcriptional regulator n=1 Tax=Massilibacillus massiliensis TaxID=1806837 RepID=UPI0018FEFB09|nr:GntR family transcriptional regulator [Massilibacillus massiliensis]